MGKTALAQKLLLIGPHLAEIICEAVVVIEYNDWSTELNRS